MNIEINNRNFAGEIKSLSDHRLLKTLYERYGTISQYEFLTKQEYHDADKDPLTVDELLLYENYFA
jgi:hypothetical protein